MDDALEAPPRPPLPRWAVWSILAGTVVAIAAVAGLIWLPDPSTVDDVAATQSSGLAFATATPARAAAIDRMFIAPATSTSDAATPGAAPTSADPASQPTQAQQPTQPPPPPPTEAPAVTSEPPVEIIWTQEEKYALSWLCWYEVRGMGINKISACLSVISTVRVRYAYNSGFGVSDVISAINAPGQFVGVAIDTSRPSPDPELLAAVEQYQAGARGACNGYPYFDSLPNGPMTCVIYGPGGQFEEFHHGRSY